MSIAAVSRIAAATALSLVFGCTDGSSAAVAKARAGDPAPLCQAVCTRVSSCSAVDGFEGVPACTRSCTEPEDLWTDACREASVGFMACELRLSCSGLRSALDGERLPTDPCEAERQALQACQPPAEDFIYFQF